MDIVRFCLISSSVCSTFPIAVPRHEAFLDWNLTVCFTSLILSVNFSPSAKATGNFPSLTRTLPNNLVTCLATESEAKRTSYFLHHFFIFVLSLLKALRPSTSMKGIPLAVASSMWAALARTQTYVKKSVYFDFGIDFMGETDCAGEPFFRIIVSETDLQLDSLNKLSLLSFSNQFADGFLQELGIDLGHFNEW